MRALDLVVDRLADVVEQPGRLADVDVRADLGGQAPAMTESSSEWCEHVLPIAGAEFEPAQQLDQVRMQADDIRLVGDALALFADRAVQLGLRLVDDFLDPGRVDPAVLQQLLQHAPRQFAAERIVCRDGDDLGRVVDDQVDPGRLLERADIAALAADDPALHFVARKRHDRYRGFRDVIGGDALDRRREDLARAALGFFV